MLEVDIRLLSQRSVVFKDVEVMGPAVSRWSLLHRSGWPRFSWIFVGLDIVLSPNHFQDVAGGRDTLNCSAKESDKRDNIK